MQLTKQIIISRHNLRFPMQPHDFALSDYSNFNFAPIPMYDELTNKGIILEQEAGAYFRNYWEKQNFDFRTMYCATNWKNRCYETAEFFLEGAGISWDIFRYDKENSIFNSAINLDIDDADALIDDEYNYFGAHFNALTFDLKEEYDLATKFFHYPNSNHARKYKLDNLMPRNIKIKIEDKEWVKCDAVFRPANYLTDTLIHQYLDNPKLYPNIDTDFIYKLSKICECYPRLLEAPRVAHNVAYKLLMEIKRLMINEYEFAFLSGHDHNIMTIITALNLKVPALIGAPFKAPIAAKLVFSEWDNEFITCSIVYPSLNMILTGKEEFIERPINFWNNKNNISKTDFIAKLI